MALDTITILDYTGLTINAEVIQTDFFGGSHKHIHKVAWGSAGVLTLVDAANPMPIQLSDGTLVASIRNTGSSDSLNVAIVDASGAQITSFGGSGAQYTEGDVDATITGTALMWEDTGDTLRAVSAAKPLPVSVGNFPATQPVSIAGTVTITGTVDTEFPAGAALADATANPTTPAIGAFNTLYNGATWDRMRGDTTNGVDVDVTRMSALVASAARIGKVTIRNAADSADLDPLTDTQLRATAVPVSGTVTATGPLTDTQLRATPVPVSGTVTATTGGLTDTQLRATAVPVSGPVTDTQLRATAVPVSGTVTATGPLTDTQLRATPVPVSGTVTATTGGLTDTQLRATAVPVDTELPAAAAPADAAANPTVPGVGSFVSAFNGTTWDRWQGTTRGQVVAATTAAWVAATGDNTAISISVLGYATAVVSLNPTGTFTAGTLNFEASDDAGTTWYPIFGVRIEWPMGETAFSLVGSAKTVWQFDVSGMTNMRVRLSPQITGSSTPTANIRLQGSATTADVTLSATSRMMKGLQTTTITSSTSETTIITAPGANVYADVFRFVITNTSASACKVTIKDATAGTTRFVFQIPAGETRGFSANPDGAAIQAASNSNWTATCGTSVADIVITSEYVKNR